MKKMIAILLMALLVGSLTACVAKRCDHEALRCPACGHEFTPPDED